METQLTFDNNPSLIAFIPFLYLAWADADLTTEEIHRISALIEAMDWMGQDEKDFLRSYLNPSSPPSPQTLKKWQQTIRNYSNELSDELTSDLSNAGIKLAEVHSKSSSELSEQVQTSLKEIEKTLGILSRESAYHLRSAGHHTQTAKQETEGSFAPSKLGEILDGENKEVIDQVKKLLTTDAFDYISPESSLSEYREQVLKWSEILAKNGLGSIAYPSEYGGEDDMKKYFAVMETLSYHDLSLVIKFGVQFGLWGMSVFFLGTEKHHKRYLKKIGSMELPGCFAMTETGHGSNVKGLETTATYDHNNQSFIIHTPHEGAGKEYIGNAAVHGRMATVFAKLIIDDTDYGVNAFVVPLRDEEGNTLPGIRIEDNGKKMGLNGVDNGKIWFDQVSIPKDEMLDKYASVDENGTFQSPITSDNRRFFTMLGTLVGGRIGIPRSGLSASKTGLAIAIKYGNSRKQFGPENGQEVSILNYRTHQRRLFPLLANAYASHFALQHLTDRFLNRTEKDMQEIEAMAAGLKAFVTWNTTHTLQECREALGGKGYLSENRIDRLKNDTEIYTTFEGDNTVLMQLVAKSRLSEFKKEFADINFFGMLNYIADKALTGITEMNPITVRNTNTDHLLDFDFHLKAFQHREKEIVMSAAKRFKKHLDNGMDSFDAFNQTQYHMLHVGFAYVERVMLEQFINQVNQTQDKDCKAILTKVCQLFALTQIEKNKGWYLEHGYMDGTKTKAIRKLGNQLCWDLRKDAVPLVEAFGIPDKLLAAPIVVD